ncbi:MAG TPA: ABC transporter substrate-binding protein [Gryllotalpicola sp.]
MKKSVTALALGTAVIATIALAGCSGAAAAGGGTAAKSGTKVDKVVIGSLHPETGSSAADGQAMDNGAQMAVDAINKAGGIKSLGGAKLELDKGDTKGTPDVASTEANREISDGAVALIGTYASGVSTTISALAEKAQVPFVMDISAADSILQQGYKYSFRVQPSATAIGTQGADAVAAIAAKNGVKLSKVGYLYDQGAGETSLEVAFAKEAKAKGFTVDTAIKYDSMSLTDATTQIAQIKAAGDTTLIVSGYYADSLAIAKSIAASGIKLDAVFGVGDGAYDQQTFLTDAPNGGEGYYNTNYAIAKSAEGQQFATDYQAKFNTPVRTGAALAYDAVQVIAAGLEDSGSADPVKLRDAIAAEKSYTGIAFGSGPIAFSSTGENTSARTVATQILGGKVTVVYPDDQATGTAKFPAF